MPVIQICKGISIQEPALRLMSDSPCMGSDTWEHLQSSCGPGIQESGVTSYFRALGGNCNVIVWNCFSVDMCVGVSGNIPHPGWLWALWVGILECHVWAWWQVTQSFCFPLGTRLCDQSYWFLCLEDDRGNEISVFVFTVTELPAAGQRWRKCYLKVWSFPSDPSRGI